MALQSEKSQGLLRIRLYFEEGFSDLHSRKCWCLIDKATCPKLADLRKVIKRRFSLACRKSELEFKMDDFSLLAEESIEILKESDVIHVSLNENLKNQRKEKHKSTSCHTKSSVQTDVAKPVKRRKVFEQKDDGLCSKRSKDEPRLHSVTFKTKKDATVRKTKPLEQEVVVPTKSSSKTSTLVKLKETFKKKKEKKEKDKKKSKTVEPSQSLSSKKSSIPIVNLNNLSNNHEKHVNVSQNKPRSNGLGENDAKEIMEMASPIRIDNSINMVGGNAKDMKGKKNKLQDNRQQHRGTFEKRSSTPFHVLSYKDGERKTPCATQLGPVSLQLYNNTSLNDIATVNDRKGSHLYFNSDEEEYNTDPKGGLQKTIRRGAREHLAERGNVSFSEKCDDKKSHNQRFAPSCVKDHTLSDRYSNSSVILTNTLAKGGPVGSENPTKEKVDAIRRENDTNGQEEPENKKVQKDYSTYPSLDRLPQPGDLIAYKVMELSLSYTPEISSFKEAAVLSYDSTTDAIELELSKASLGRCIGDGHITRKFELSEDEEEGEEKEPKETDDSKVTHYFKELIDPKLIL